MANNPRRKSDAARRANQVIRSRTVLMMALLGVATFLALFWKLYDLQIRQHTEPPSGRTTVSSARLTSGLSGTTANSQSATT